jgi:hypothetical protein
MEAYVVYPSKAQEKVIKAFLNIPFEKKEEEVLPPHVIEGIAKGQADIQAGHAMSFEDFKKRLTISK